MKKCTKCGTTYNDDELRFCMECGSPLEEVKEEPKQEVKKEPKKVEPVVETKKVEPTKVQEEPKKVEQPKESAVEENQQEEAKAESVAETKKVEPTKVQEETKKVEPTKPKQSFSFHLSSKLLYQIIVVSGVVLLVVSLFLRLKAKDYVVKGFFGSESDPEIQNIKMIIRLCVWLVYAGLAATVAVVVGFIYQRVKKLDESQESMVSMIISAVQFVFMILSLPIFKFLNAYFNGDTSDLLTTGLDESNIGNMQTYLTFFIVAVIANVVLAGYFLSQKKYDQTAANDNSVKVDFSGLVEKFNGLKQTKQGKRKLYVIGAVVVALVLGLGYNAFFKKTKVDLTANCEVTFDGYDGEGRAHYSCDPDYDKNDSRMSDFMATVYPKLDKEYDLSNGDKVKLTVKYSEQTAKGAKIKAINPTKTFKVKGLKKTLKKYTNISEVDRINMESAADDAAKAYFKDHSPRILWDDEDEKITINSMKKIATFFRTADGKTDVVYLYSYNITSQLKDDSKEFKGHLAVSYDGLTPSNTESFKDYEEVSKSYDSDDTDQEAIHMYVTNGYKKVK